jgi:phospholipid/cholesterol/gamma-HCH transport system substrate-binding protein
MRGSKVNYVMVGGFVIASLIGLIIAIALLTGRTGAVDTYKTIYENVAGIKFGTQVTYEGYPVGQIEAIRPKMNDDGQMRFEVEMSVIRGWKIPDDSSAVISASGLLSAVVIDIQAGRSKNFLKPGSIIHGKGGGNLFSAVSAIAGEMGDLAQNHIKPLVENLNRYIDGLGKSLEEGAPDLVRNILMIVADLAEKTPRITTSIDQMTDRFNKGSASVASPENVASLDHSIKNVEVVSGNLAKLSHELEATRRRMDNLFATLDSAATETKGPVTESAKELKHSLSAVSRYIDSITYNLEGTSRNMHEFSRHIRQNPGLLLGGTPPKDEAAASPAPAPAKR